MSSALAVVDVRRGTRSAFSRASRPDRARAATNGAASTRDHRPRGQRGGHEHADDSASSCAEAEEARHHRRPERPRPRRPRRPGRASTTPDDAAPAQPLRRGHDLVAHGGDGRDPDARRAGQYRREHGHPDADEQRPDDGAGVHGQPAGDLQAERAEQALSSPAPARARRARPISDPSEPDDDRLAEHDARRPAARPAPTARSRASSRVRWATSIENVLKMMNTPTSTLMKAKTSRKTLMKPRRVADRLLGLVGDRRAGDGLGARRQRVAAIRSRSVGWLDAGCGPDARTTAPCRPGRTALTAVASSTVTMVAPASPTSNDASPTIGHVGAAAPPTTAWVRSPTARPRASACRDSSTTSAGPAGARPCDERAATGSSLAERRSTKLGAPPLRDRGAVACRRATAVPWMSAVTRCDARHLAQRARQAERAAAARRPGCPGVGDVRLIVLAADLDVEALRCLGRRCCRRCRRGCRSARRCPRRRRRRA